MSEPKPPSGMCAEGLETALQGSLEAGASARRTVPLDRLWIRVDSDSSSTPQATGDGGVRIVAGELSDFVEVSALAGGRRVPLISFSLFNELRSFSRSRRPTREHTFTTRIEGDRKISVTIRPTNGSDGLPAYELVARAGYSKGHAWTISWPSLSVKEFAVVSAVLLCALIIGYRVWLQESGEVAQTKPTQSPVYAPSATSTPAPTASSTPSSVTSPSPSATAHQEQSTPIPSGPSPAEIARSVQPPDTLPPRVNVIKPEGTPAKGETGSPRSRGADTIPVTVPLPDVQTIFVNFPQDGFGQEIAASLKKRLKDLGIKTEIQENEAEAALTISTDAASRFSFVIVSGRKEIWGPMSLEVHAQSADDADNVAASVASEIGKALKRSGKRTP